MHTYAGLDLHMEINVSLTERLFVDWGFAPMATAAADADIIAFPAERARPPSPESRLARALASLEAALAEQRTAARALHDASATLRTTVAGLEARLVAHRDGLQHLATEVTLLNGEARRLEAWADSMIVSTR